MLTYKQLIAKIEKTIVVHEADLDLAIITHQENLVHIKDRGINGCKSSSKIYSKETSNLSRGLGCILYYRKKLRRALKHLETLRALYDGKKA